MFLPWCSDGSAGQAEATLPPLLGAPIVAISSRAKRAGTYSFHGDGVLAAGIEPVADRPLSLVGNDGRLLDQDLDGSS